MVTQISEKGYECPECGEKFLEYDDCKYHIEYEHSEEPFETNDCFKCDMCNKEFYRESEAVECERKHKKKNDLHYGMYIDAIEKAKLLVASSHPEQLRLEECL